MFVFLATWVGPTSVCIHLPSLPPQVEALGYVGLGFSPTGGMHGADILLAWVDPDTGALVLSVSRVRPRRNCCT